MVQFIDDHRAGLRVEPICAVLPIAPQSAGRVLAHALDVCKT